MRNRAVEYPHPVLNEYTQDYIDSSFEVEVLSHTDNGPEIILELECKLNCNGIARCISEGKAKAVLRLTCYRTSYRDAFDLDPFGSTIIRIEKKRVSGSIDLQAIIVATDNIRGFKLQEFNPLFFADADFLIRKGDVLANEPGIVIKLDTSLEKNMAGIVLVRGDQHATSICVHFAEANEEQPDLLNYIVITLPDSVYKNYARIMSKKHLKNGVERFIQASVILPVITEAVGRLRSEEIEDGDESSTQYRGTVWADSIYDALRRYGITELADSQMSDTEIANMLLGDVLSDSISNLMQKLTEWSTIREEDPNL